MDNHYQPMMNVQSPCRKRAPALECAYHTRMARVMASSADECAEAIARGMSHNATLEVSIRITRPPRRADSNCGRNGLA